MDTNDSKELLKTNKKIGSTALLVQKLISLKNTLIANNMPLGAWGAWDY